MNEVGGALGKNVVRRGFRPRGSDLDFLGQTADAFETADDFLDLGLLTIGRHVPGQGYNAVFDSDANVGRIDAGFKLKLVIDELL